MSDPRLKRLSEDPTDIDIKIQTAASEGWWAYYWLGDENAFRRVPVALWVTLVDHSARDGAVETVRPFVITVNGIVMDYLHVEDIDAFVAVLGPQRESHGIVLGQIMQKRGIDINKIAPDLMREN